MVHHSGLSFSCIDGREQQWAPLERPRAQSNPREGQDPNLSSAGRAPTLQRPPHQPPLRPSSGPRDCRHSPHGCCPDGHTPSYISLSPTTLSQVFQPCNSVLLILYKHLPPSSPPRTSLYSGNFSFFFLFFLLIIRFLFLYP